MANHKERDMENTKIALVAFALLLATHTQANPTSKGKNAGDCALPASVIGVAVLHAAGPNENRTGMRTNQKRLRNGSITVDRPASCNYATRIATTAFSSALK
jgi:hypothetical protein